MRVKRYLLTVMLAGLCGVPVLAQHTLHYLHVDVCLYKDGSARVTEKRTCSIGEQGTEGFITMNNMGDIGIGNLKVTDELGVEYTTDEGDWNTERTRAEKTNHCGIHRTDAGVELCWGIGATGMRTYEISYTLTNLVKAYSDYDGFNHSFYEAANTPAQAATLVLRLVGDSLCPPRSRFWGFGFTGDLKMESGRMLVSTTQTMSVGESIIVMTQFDKGIFEPSARGEGSFEHVKQRAFEGSDYLQDDDNGQEPRENLLARNRASHFGGAGFSGPDGSSSSSMLSSVKETLGSDGILSTIIMGIVIVLGIIFGRGGGGYRSGGGGGSRSRSSGYGGRSSRSGGGGHSGGGGSGFR